MEWTDDAIILGAAAHGEGNAVVEVLTATRGRWRGLVRGGRSSRHRAALEPGNAVRATWRGRLADQLGSLTCEGVAHIAPAILADAGRLAALRAACALLSVVLPPHDPHPRCHAALTDLLAFLAARGDWPSAYARWEMGLLADLGFGLDLARCAAGSGESDLAFVSPRSGRAVGRTAGQPYRDRLLPLPAFLTDSAATASAHDMCEALRLTGYFLERHVVGEGARSALPAARRALAGRFAAERQADPDAPKP